MACLALLTGCSDGGGEESGGGGDGADDAEPASTVQVAVTAGEPDATTEAPTTTEAREPITVVVVAPSPRDDRSFTQSMVESMEHLAEALPIELVIDDELADVDAAGRAMAQAAAGGADLVIAHGSQYGATAREVAAAHPDVAFAVGTAALEDDAPPNLYGYTARSDEGGYVNGLVAARLTTSGTVGVVAPIAVGDAARYVIGFIVGAAAVDEAVQVESAYLDSYTNVDLAREAAATQIALGADVLSGTSQVADGARQQALDAGLPWLATQSSQNELGDDVVVSQVYHWDVAFGDLAEDLSTEGDIGGGGPLPALTLANGGLTVEFNDDFALDPTIRAAADEAIAGLSDGSLTTGVP